MMPNPFSRRACWILGCWFIALLGQTIVADPAHGQLFGPRRLGGTLSRQPRPGSLGQGQDPLDVGTLRNQRFVRGNRSARNFVGADRTETREFVGLEQAGAAAGAVRSAVTGAGLSGDNTFAVNQPLSPAPTTRLYDPKLVIGFELAPLNANLLAQEISESLSSLSNQISVSVAERTATIRGEVASEEDRRLAEILASFEPGISAVQNDLRVVGDMEVVPPPPTPTE